MKSTTFAILGVIINGVVASPWGYEGAPQPTVTVTYCPSGVNALSIPSQAQYNGENQYHEATTVTVTETSTVTSIATVKSSVAAIYTNVPPKPGMSTTWVYGSGSGAGSAGSTGFGTATASAISPTATGTAAGATTTITVGLNAGQVLKFDPPYLPKVTIGDKLHFDFRALNHTLTESSLEAPCAKLMGTEVDTDFQNVNKMDIPNFKPFDLTITENKPRFFYCKQANHTPKSHCGKGMVFAVNVDAAKFATFEQNAEATGLLPVPIRRRFMA